MSCVLFFFGARIERFGFALMSLFLCVQVTSSGINAILDSLWLAVRF